MRNHLAIEDDLREISQLAKDHEESIATAFKRLEILERRFAEHIGEETAQAEVPRYVITRDREG